MISSILGGNKRAESIVPEPLDQVPPLAPANGFEAEAPVPAASPIKPEAAHAATKPVEPPPPVPTTPAGKRLLPAEAIADLVLGELRKLDGFPASGVSVTVYGYRHWNAMITFDPFSTTLANATRFRQALPELVFKLRRLVELEL
jgi:hypothetical protein